MIFHTRNSTYEVDLEGKRIRRLNGKADPTSRQGIDGTWKDFERITDIVQGTSVLIVWSEQGTIPSTLTSLVTKVVDRPIEKAN